MEFSAFDEGMTVTAEELSVEADGGTGLKAGTNVDLFIINARVNGTAVSVDVAGIGSSANVTFSRITSPDMQTTCGYVTDLDGVPTASATTCP